MGLFLNFPEGGWSLHSDKDPRWNCSGRSDCVGGFVMPQECKDKIEQLKSQLGEPPDDLKWSYMKD
ncbi:MAG: hypothetical protein PHZ25_02355 [Candidatus Pacebacteria bacterium]|nr:hypothetical protein [Candidatus Paceibacterota bacterium]